MKNLKFIAVIAIVAILLLVVALPTNAAFEGVTVTVTSNVGNGTEVNPGDEIIYNVKMENKSDKDYIAPIVWTFAPEQTKITNIEVDQTSENNYKEFDDEMAVCGTSFLTSGSQVNFKITVKVNEDATGSINFANVTESDEEGFGALMVVLFASDVTEEEMNNIQNLNIDDYDNLADFQEALGDNVYVDIITQPQTNPIKVQETAEEPVEEPTEEETTEEPVEEAKTEEKKEDSTKPSKLPKTGAEYSVFAIISALVMLAIGIKLTK